MYARGINDSALVPGEDKFLQIVSCNTHNLAILIKTLGMDDTGALTMNRAQFVCMRRANDISQTKDYPPLRPSRSTTTRNSARTTRTTSSTSTRRSASSRRSSPGAQAQHAVHALGLVQLRAERQDRQEEGRRAPQGEPTRRAHGAQERERVSSFGRDHGYYGRILSQTVISTPTLAVADAGREIVGFCFTPQDGNSLLSSVAGAIWLMDPEHASTRIQVLKRFVFSEI